MARLVAVRVGHARAVQRRARLDARALLTARLHDLPTAALALEACWCSAPTALDEQSDVALRAVRLAAAALGCEPANLLAALLTDRAAVEAEQAEQARGEG